MNGEAFDDEDVVRCYAHRPPYAPMLFEALLGLVAARERVVDLGCGPGMIADALASHFTEVIAIDPSGPMIAAARARYADRHSNIHWVQARAEDADLGGPVDLAVAGASIHWMSHDALFPKLAEHTSRLAVIFGDGPDQPPWQATWDAAMREWIPRFSWTSDPVVFTAEANRYEAWIDIAGRDTFVTPIRQSLEDFIACQHSRATWTRARMGPEDSRAFDEDLDTRLRPWTTDGLLTFNVRNHLVWGCPRRTPRA